MDWTPFQDWLSTTNLLEIVGLLFVAMLAATAVGTTARHWREKRRSQPAEKDGGHEGYLVSGVLGLLAFLLGFTFSLAVDRFDARRNLVREEANAIGTTYLRAQLLTEPHRTRMSELLIRYTDNRLKLAQAKPGKAGPYVAVNDALITDIWTAVSASFDSIKGLDFSSAYLDSVNAVIDLDEARKAARLARVPAEVFAVLFVYLITTAGVLGYVLQGKGGRLTAGCLLALFTLSLALVIDIDRPTLGGITESQGPMERLKASMATKPRSVYDRWKTPPEAPADAPPVGSAPAP